GVKEVFILIALRGDVVLFRPLFCFERSRNIWNLTYLVAATGLQSLWSLSLAIIDIYALLVRRSLQNSRVVTLFAIGDGLRARVRYRAPEISDHFVLTLCSSLQITSTLTFAAACASAGITVLIDNNLDSCAQNHCTQFETSTAMAFVCWFTALPSFLLNFWSLALHPDRKEHWKSK
ncbi:hypothetical protein Goari_020055, partial [Gossypium aridum]|nr:hypothetical protein [Gossypium aridum]